MTTSRKSKPKKKPTRPVAKQVKAKLLKPAKKQAAEAKRLKKAKAVSPNMQAATERMMREPLIESPAPTTTKATPTDRSPEPVVLPKIITTAKISPHVQGTEEWHRERLGRLSASRMHRVINGTMKGWQSLMAELREEIRNPEGVLSEEPMYSEDAEHGREYEDAARAEAELLLDMDIVCVGYATHPKYDWLGASVDGLILEDDGTI